MQCRRLVLLLCSTLSGPSRYQQALYFFGENCPLAALAVPLRVPFFIDFNLRCNLSRHRGMGAWLEQVEMWFEERIGRVIGLSSVDRAEAVADYRCPVLERRLLPKCLYPLHFDK